MIKVKYLYHAMKTTGEGRYSSTILISTLDGGEWSASRICRFTFGDKPHYPLNKRLGEHESRSGHNG
jgi:hypothetical protein